MTSGKLVMKFNSIKRKAHTYATCSRKPELHKPWDDMIVNLLHLQYHIHQNTLAIFVPTCRICKCWRTSKFVNCNQKIETDSFNPHLTESVISTVTPMCLSAYHPWMVCYTMIVVLSMPFRPCNLCIQNCVSQKLFTTTATAIWNYSFLK